MRKEVKQNVLTYLAFVLITIVGIIYGKSLVGHYQFLRLWDFQNILLLSFGIPFCCLYSFFPWYLAYLNTRAPGRVMAGDSIILQPGKTKAKFFINQEGFKNFLV